MSKFIARFMMLMLVSAHFGAIAAPVIQTATCTNTTNQCATGITGLDVMGMTFDVTFQTGSYNAVFSGFDPFFLDDPTGAGAAASAIVSLFDGVVYGIFAEPVVDVDGFPGIMQAWIPAQAQLGAWDAAPAPETRTTAPSVWTFGSGATRSRESIIAGNGSYFVVFDKVSVAPPSDVPEPGTLALLGLGLAGMGFSRRKKKA